MSDRVTPASGPTDDKSPGGHQPTSFDIIRGFLDSAPVDLLKMASALGLRVDLHAHFPNNESGRIKRIGAGHDLYEIEINGKHSDYRKRFTLAHEISHYILHREQIGDGITDDALYRSGLSHHIETEANKFAAELIMPAQLVRTLYRAGVRSLNQLGETLGVSEEALRIRLKQLRLDP